MSLAGHMLCEIPPGERIGSRWICPVCATEWRVLGPSARPAPRPPRPAPRPPRPDPVTDIPPPKSWSTPPGHDCQRDLPRPAAEAAGHLARCPCGRWHVLRFNPRTRWVPVRPWDVRLRARIWRWTT